MLEWLHRVYVWTVLVLPSLMLVRAVVGARQRRRERLAGLVGLAAVGVAIGVSLCVGYAAVGRGSVRWGQAGITSYLAVSVLLVLRGWDWGVTRLARRVFGVDRWREDGPLEPAAGWRRASALAVRFVLLFAVGLPFLMAVGLTYRPKVGLVRTPREMFGFAYRRVEFPATDGVRISGWWVPAQQDGRARAAGRTVLVCHGIAANRSLQFAMARALVPAGYNVLAIDLRGHGESGGQLTGFGALERRDVLGAVRWLRANHPEEARTIDGVGASSGAAALIAAAADDSAEGRAIGAVVAYGSFARLDAVVGSMASQALAPPVARLVVAVGLPMASVQVGEDLVHFDVGALAWRVWPRPILVVHGAWDEVVPWEQGAALHRAAAYPKDSLWIERVGLQEVIDDDSVAQYVRRFLDRARPEPAI